MMHMRVVCATAFLGCSLWLLPAPVLAQTEQENVPLIMLTPQGAGISASHLRKLYASLKRRSRTATSQVLPLTKTQVWTVPKEEVEGVRKAAAQHGVVMSRLSATWNRVFDKAPADAKINERQKSIMDRAKASAATMAVGLMAVPPPPMVEYALTKDASTPAASQGMAKIAVQLSDNTLLTINRTGVEVKPRMAIWHGTVDDTDSPVTIMWWPDGRMTGTVQHAGRLYSIRHLGGKLHAVVEMGEDRMPPEHAPMSPAKRAQHAHLADDPLVTQGDASSLRPITVGMRTLAPEDFGTKERRDLAKVLRRLTRAKPKAAGSPDEVIIDVIIAYTKSAAASYSDVRRELVELAIEEANQSFRLSNLRHIKLRLANAYQTDYVEQGEHFTHLWRFADKGDGHMEEIHGLRDKHHADVAVLIVDDASGCGLATRVFAEEHDAFAVVHHGCAATSYSIAHEIGHLIGARHDPSTDKNTKPFPYGHGYVNGSKWRDIMSYKEPCGGCPRVPVWSSPTVTVRGERAGTSINDNARVLTEQAARVAGFR
jgi:Metallo-peptidase family M12